MKRIIFTFILKIVTSEWIEIVPISYKNLSVTTEIPSTTVSYEITMKAPYIEKNVRGIPSNQTKIPNIQKVPILKKKLETRNNIDEFEDENVDTIDKNGFLGFLKTIQNKILKYKIKSPKSKMSVLKHIRDNLLLNIHERIVNLWKPRNNEARGYKDDDYHMDFPSNEGALMTIGFLTFAVFLIKLVIKLVHLIKYKQQYYGINTSTTTAASIVFLKRKGRDIETSDETNILQYIEELRIK